MATQNMFEASRITYATPQERQKYAETHRQICQGLNEREPFILVFTRPLTNDTVSQEDLYYSLVVTKFALMIFPAFQQALGKFFKHEEDVPPGVLGEWFSELGDLYLGYLEAYSGDVNDYRHVLATAFRLIALSPQEAYEEDMGLAAEIEEQEQAGRSDTEFVQELKRLQKIVFRIALRGYGSLCQEVHVLREYVAPNAFQWASRQLGLQQGDWPLFSLRPYTLRKLRWSILRGGKVGHSYVPLYREIGHALVALLEGLYCVVYDKDGLRYKRQFRRWREAYRFSEETNGWLVPPVEAQRMMKEEGLPRFFFNHARSLMTYNTAWKSIASGIVNYPGKIYWETWSNGKESVTVLRHTVIT